MGEEFEEDGDDTAVPGGTVRVIQVAPEASGSRLDRFLAGAFPGFSRARLQRLIDGEAVRVNGRAMRPSYALRSGDEILVEVPPEVVAAPPAPEDIPLEVVYEDEDLMVIDKPAGLVVHPSETVTGGTLVNALLGRGGPLSTIGGSNRPGILHRLDKGTSGLLLVARQDESHRRLADALRRRDIHRHYRAVAWGRFPEVRGTIDAGIGRDEHQRLRMAVRASGGRPAVTHFEVRRAFAWATELALRLETGRTHQIRVHLAHRRHPLFGDATYGGRRVPAGLTAREIQKARALLDGFRRPALHAERLEFEHPRTGRPMRFEAPLPGDMTALLAALEEAA